MKLQEYKEKIEQRRNLGEDVIVPKDKTAENYLNYIMKFFGFLEENGLTDNFYRYVDDVNTDGLATLIDKWMNEGLNEYVVELPTHTYRGKYKLSTKKFAVFGVISYLNYVHNIYIDYKQIPTIRAVRAKQFKPNLFSPHEVESILDYSSCLLKQDTVEKPFRQPNRNLYVGIQVGWDAICRSVELTRIKLDDLDIDESTMEGYVYIRAAKGSRSSWIPLSQETVMRVANVISHRKSRGNLGKYLLVREKSGQQGLTPENWEAQFNHLCKMVLGKNGYYRFHDFSRHTRITWLFKMEEWSFDDVWSRARHKHRSMTEKYMHLEYP